MTDEVWRDIEGYEMIYQVSNMGRVKRLDGIDSQGRNWKGRILSPGIDKGGYLKVCLYKEGKVNRFLVHRLVAHAFIPNPEGLPQINHIDEDKTNNLVDNLEYCDCKYNCNYGTHTERQVQTMIRKGIFDPEMCGLDRNERKRLYYQKNKERLKEYQREYMRMYRLKKKQEKKDNRPSEESLW